MKKRTKSKTPRILVVYYSRTGITRKVAQELAKILDCDCDEIIDTVDRAGVKGYMISGRDAMLKNLTKLEPAKKDPSKYDLVVVGTPIWAGKISAPLRTYLAGNKSNLKKLAFFCTQGGSGADKACEEMERAFGKLPVAKLALLTKEVVTGQFNDKISAFAKLIKK